MGESCRRIWTRGTMIIETESPNGIRLFMRHVNFPIKNDKGFRFGSPAQDITNEKAAGDALLESEERFRYLVNTSLDMI